MNKKVIFSVLSMLFMIAGLSAQNNTVSLMGNGSNLAKVNSSIWTDIVPFTQNTIGDLRQITVNFGRPVTQPVLNVMNDFTSSFKGLNNTAMDLGQTTYRFSIPRTFSGMEMYKILASKGIYLDKNLASIF